MADPKYPNVPLAPGVPPVFRRADAPGVSATGRALQSDAPGVSATSRTKWGLYTADGALALEVDSVVSVEPHRESRLSDYPTEQGGFQSYNKVQTPAETRLTVTKGGRDADRQAFLAKLDGMVTGLDLFAVVMPDGTLPNRSVVRYDYARHQDRGATLLTVEIGLTQVRQTASSAFADSKAASGTGAAQGGPVQAQPATVTQTPLPAPPSANPAVQAIPAITADMSQPQRAATVTRLIEAGATTGDLVTKGASFLAIPTTARPSQIMTTQLGGQSVRLAISQKAGGLFTDVYVNDVLKLGGARVENDNPLLRSGYLGFMGDLIFHDTQGGLTRPNFEDLGSRLVLLYAGA